MFSNYLLKIWCIESEGQKYQNWTVNSGQHYLEMSDLKQGKQYWITIAAVNGAGVGMLSDPHGFVISEYTFLHSPPSSVV